MKKGKAVRFLIPSVDELRAIIYTSNIIRVCMEVCMHVCMYGYAFRPAWRYRAKTYYGVGDGPPRFVGILILQKCGLHGWLLGKSSVRL